MPAYLLALLLATSGAAAEERLLIVPWELLSERRVGEDGELRLAVDVTPAGGEGWIVGGDPAWRSQGVPSWIVVRPERVRRRGRGVVAVLEVVCDPSLAPPEERPPGSRCGELRIGFDRVDVAGASRALGRLTLGPEEDPVADLAPHAAGILDGGLGRGPLGIDAELQAWLLWTLRPREGWPRLAFDTTAERPTLRLDVQLARPAELPLPCWAERTVEARAFALAELVGGALREHGYALDLDLHLLAPPDDGPVLPDPREPLDGSGRLEAGGLFESAGATLGGLFGGELVWDELRVRIPREALGRWLAGALPATGLRDALELSWNGQPVPGDCR